MTPRNRKRLGLVLLVALFLTPLLAAIVLNAVGWRPAGTRNYGELVEPPRPLADALFVLDGGEPLRWEDADWSWTLFALPGPGCADACIADFAEAGPAFQTYSDCALPLVPRSAAARDVPPPRGADRTATASPVRR